MPTTIVHAAPAEATGFGALVARLFTELTAFFEESGRALHRAHRDYPFGL
ncbi:hypothetical protein GCM10008171_09070 [Methylopila jiangsuensis]|uniref:Uncharacterized protein n=1 Tax=Methylopila jiangsuensis TaxID=586230 RepID=A0A9W6JHK0_9HYPH|nr:hypothetical protein [Methylopila jiangsuensis]MDR6285895.1 hypothetical protein [Methylopila jiangsuensis]GLK75653.1 hypothetical protein GCM10008171_09070 [Methylopila jiangsuensis]